jgi:hypothetical protein
VWKAVVKWVRDRVAVDVDVDLSGSSVAVAVTVMFNEAVLIAERFEWTLASPGAATKLVGRSARRTSTPVGG